MSDWQVDPKPVDPDIAVAADTVEARLPHLTNSPTSVLPLSALRGTTFEDLLSTADAETLRAFRNAIV